MAPYPALGGVPAAASGSGEESRVISSASQNFEREHTEGERVPNRGPPETLDGIGFLAGFLTVISLVYALLRQAIEYRRWRRQIQIQTDIHTKLLDRMTNNQELLAYIETPAGRRFLEAPVPLMAQPPAASIAPVTRILWSVQIGVVVVAAGIGFWIARRRSRTRTYLDVPGDGIAGDGRGGRDSWFRH